MTNGKPRFDLAKIQTMAIEGDTNQAHRIAMAARLLAKHNYQIAGGWVKVKDGEFEKLPDRIKNQCRVTLAFNPDGSVTEFMARPPQSSDPDGEYGPGLLLFQDALEVIEDAQGKGLSPLSHYHLWYMKGRLVKHIDYKITVGVAGLVLGERFSFKDFDMTADELEAVGCKAEDMGKIAYLIPMSQMPLYAEMLKTYLLSGTDRKEAQRYAAEDASLGAGVGVLTAREKGIKKQSPMGRTWDFFALKRAEADAINRTIGKIPPQYFKAFLEQDHGQTVIEASDYDSLMALPENLPDDLQAKYLEQDRRVEALQSTDWDEGLFVLGDDGPMTLQEKAKKNIRDMRGDKEEQEGID